MAPHFPQLEMIDILGFGGMGVVYKARQKSLDRMVAVKVLPPDPHREASFAERFTREARALARMQHPNIVTVYDSGQSDDLYFLIMELVDGANLRRLMDAKQLSPEQALAIVPHICDALHYAHEEGIAHRDIKPENILIDTKGRLKIADFGLAKILNARVTDYALTSPIQVLGTMHYMAPEQIERSADVDHRADIYALGVVIYEMLTGELPIGRFPLPSEKSSIDARLDEIVLKALEKSPDKRWQNVSDIRTEIESLSIPIQTPAQSMWGTVSPHLKSLRERVAGIVSPPDQRGASTGSAPNSNAPAAPNAITPVPMPVRLKNSGTAYLLWCACLLSCVGVPAFGIHRFYLGRWKTGLLWLLTFGCLFIGQLIDLFRMESLIRSSNERIMQESYAHFVRMAEMQSRLQSHVSGAEQSAASESIRTARAEST